MYIRTTKSQTSNLIKVYLVEGYRDENGKSKQRIIKCYGNLHELESKDPNILEKLRAEAKKMPSTTTTVSINFDTSKSNDTREKDKNYGYFFLEALYKQFKIDQFLKPYYEGSTKKNSIDEILKLLLFSRILNPASKRATVVKKDEFFTPFKVTLDATYEGLTKLSELSESLQLHLHQQVTENYGRDVSLVFYDVTNYYFETESESEMKKTGISKEKKKTPIVQMALAIDQKGIPVGYRLFPGNTHDSVTMIPTLEAMKKSYGLDRIILTADKGLNSGKNLLYLLKRGDGYIVSQKVRGASKSFIDSVIDDDCYHYNKSGSFKIKSFIRERSVKDEDGTTQILKEKVVSFWSSDFDAREKHKRERLEERIDEYLETPSKYKASNRYGIKKYLKEVQVDTTTGEVTEKKSKLSFDSKKYERDVALDGYYALITSEIDMADEEIIARYRGLWKIEESFRVVKSDLDGRPVYVRKDDRISGHFLVCFIALLFCRIIEIKIGGEYSIRRIQESLRKATCRKLAKGFYSLNKQDEVFRAIEKAFNVNLNYSDLRVEELKSKKEELLHNIKK